MPSIEKFEKTNRPKTVEDARQRIVAARRIAHLQWWIDRRYAHLENQTPIDTVARTEP